jgi:hypothetical protein
MGTGMPERLQRKELNIAFNKETAGMSGSDECDRQKI